jgi:hypothetical protein
MKALIFLLFAAAAGCFAQARDGEFDKLAGRVFDELIFHYDPVAGTSAGFHRYDALLPAGSRAEVLEEIAVAKKFEGEVGNFDPSGLSPSVAADRELVLAQLRGQVLALENIRMWEKNPDGYSSYATSAIFTIMSRTFAPPAERLKSAIAREKLIPRMFQSARQNLINPPEIYTKVALEQLPGIESFFEKDVPAAFTQVKDAALLAEFKKSNQAVLDALRSYETFLKNDLLPEEAAVRRDGRYTARPAAGNRL